MTTHILSTRLVFLALFTFAFRGLSAADYYVATTGSDSNDGSDGLPFRTLTKATSLAAGSVVHVAPGIYKEAARVTFTKHNISLVADDGNPVNTVFDCEGVRGGITFNQSGCSISGFTVSNGYESGTQSGAGVYFNPSTGQNGVVTNCVITGCGTVGGSGGGVCIANGKVVDTLITGCYAKSQGGGVWLDYYASLENCTVEKCHVTGSYGSGGGVYAKRSSYLTGCRIVENYTDNKTNTERGGGVCGARAMTNCVIRGNISGAGGGYYMSGNCSIVNCLFENNIVSDLGSAIGTSYDVSLTSALIENCVFRGNTNGLSVVETGANNNVYDGTDINVRNCLFDRNSGRRVLYLYPANVTVDACTFLNNTNTMSRTITLQQGDNATQWSHTVVKNCLFFGTVSTKYAATPDVSYVAGNEANVNHCFTPDGMGLPEGYGNVKAYADPLLENAANGSPKLRSKSPCRDSGVVSGWMTNAKDLGDGTFAESKVNAYGIMLAANGAVNRLLGFLPDIGCSEFKSAGMTVIIR